MTDARAAEIDAIAKIIVRAEIPCYIETPDGRMFWIGRRALAVKSAEAVLEHLAAQQRDATARDAALEEAAKVAEHRFIDPFAGQQIAASIRALKSGAKT